MNALRAFLHLITKDVKAEFRGRQFFFSCIAFGMLLELIIGMALNTEGRLSPEFAAGILWLSLFFSTAIAMTKHDAKEREMGGWLGLLLIPFDRSVVFYAKWVSTGIFVLVSQVALVLSFFIILNQPPPALPLSFALVLVGGTLGLTGVCTFLATLVSQSSLRDVLLPLLLFPLCIPLFLAVIRLTVWTLTGDAFGVDVWLMVLVGYIVSMGVLPWLLFETLMEV
jgi:heme exporter protein B